MTVTVVSACFGAYDVPAVPPVQDCDVRWVMVTDGKVDVPAPWEHVVDPRDDMHPRLAAKIAKCAPWLYTDTEVAVWLDASATVNRSDFVSTCVAALGDGHVAQWVHPQRSCIRPEADVSATMAKYDGLPVHAQVTWYMAAGHPASFGLWATGCMVRSMREPTGVGVAWLAEQTRWTYQDQLSWPIIVRKYGLDVRPMPGELWDRRLVSFRGHASDL